RSLRTLFAVRFRIIPRHYSRLSRAPPRRRGFTPAASRIIRGSSKQWPKFVRSGVTTGMFCAERAHHSSLNNVCVKPICRFSTFGLLTQNCRLAADGCASRCPAQGGRESKKGAHLISVGEKLRLLF